MAEKPEGTFTEDESRQAEQVVSEQKASSRKCRDGRNHRFVVVGRSPEGRVELCTHCGAVRTEHYAIPYPEA